MKSLDELKAIRERAQESLRVRDGQNKGIISVAMGTCGIAAGARSVMTALIDELAKRQRTDISVIQTGCAGLCEKEPLVTVQLPDQSNIVYGYVNEGKAREIVARHIVHGQIISDYVVQTPASKEE